MGTSVSSVGPGRVSMGSRRRYGQTTLALPPLGEATARTHAGPVQVRLGFPFAGHADAVGRRRPGRLGGDSSPRSTTTSTRRWSRPSVGVHAGRPVRRMRGRRPAAEATARIDRPRRTRRGPHRGGARHVGPARVRRLEVRQPDLPGPGQRRHQAPQDHDRRRRGGGGAPGRVVEEARRPLLGVADRLAQRTRTRS